MLNHCLTPNIAPEKLKLIISEISTMTKQNGKTRDVCSLPCLDAKIRPLIKQK